METRKSGKRPSFNSIPYNFLIPGPGSRILSALKMGFVSANDVKTPSFSPKAGGFA